MDSFSVEASVHRIAGSDRYERTFMPTVGPVYPGPGSRTLIVLPGLVWAHHLIRVDLERVQLVRPGLWSAEARLTDTNVRPVSPPRPVLISATPCDVALYSTHVATDPEEGVYSLGLRIPRAAWAPLEETPGDTLASDSP